MSKTIYLMSKTFLFYKKQQISCEVMGYAQ